MLRRSYRWSSGWKISASQLPGEHQPTGTSLERAEVRVVALSAWKPSTAEASLTATAGKDMWRMSQGGHHAHRALGNHGSHLMLMPLQTTNLRVTFWWFCHGSYLIKKVLLHTESQGLFHLLTPLPKPSPEWAPSNTCTVTTIRPLGSASPLSWTWILVHC